MTPKEAIKWLKYMISDDCDDSQYGFVDEVEFAIEALGVIEQIRWERDVALKQLEEIGVGLGAKMGKVKDALEKQIPKKPVYYTFGKEKYPKCPCCGDGWNMNEYGNGMVHCWECGQAIDWSGEE